MMAKKTGILLLLSLFLGGFAWGLLPEDALARTQVTKHDQTQHQIQTELGTFAKLAKELKPSVVNISVVRNLGTHLELDRSPFSLDSLPEKAGQGSGVLISPDGEILTNHHVIRNARTIRAKLADGREFSAKVVGVDSNTDLALLKLEDAAELPSAQLGDSDHLEVGDWVMAIGNPFGLEATVTVGVLSGKGRVIGAGPYDDFLQTDASINPGNSGGPLFNTSGEVVGINTAIVAGGQGIGFSIPINLAKDVAAQLRSQGKVVRGFIGAGIQPLTPALRSALKLPITTEGIIVTSAVPDGPGAKAGLKTGDIITAIDGIPVSSDRELLARVARLPIDQESTFQVLRDGAPRELEITITQRPEPSFASEASPQRAASRDQPKLGVIVASPPGEASGSGVLITAIVPDTPAARAGLKIGDRIQAVGQSSIHDAAQFVSLIEQTEGEVALLIERRGGRLYIPVKL